LTTSTTSTIPHSRRNVFLLAICHAFYVTATSAIIATAALAGHMLADDKSLATLPITMQFVAMMAGTVPASFLMKRLGRRDGFSIGAVLGLAGALICMWAILRSDFAMYCLGSAFVGLDRKSVV